MRVKLHNRMAGPKGCFAPGDEIDVADDFGRELILNGQATDLARKVLAPEAPAPEASQEQADAEMEGDGGDKAKDQAGDKTEKPNKKSKPRTS